MTEAASWQRSSFCQSDECAEAAVSDCGPEFTGVTRTGGTYCTHRAGCPVHPAGHCDTGAWRAAADQGWAGTLVRFEDGHFRLFDEVYGKQADPGDELITGQRRECHVCPPLVDYSAPEGRRYPERMIVQADTVRSSRRPDFRDG